MSGLLQRLFDWSHGHDTLDTELFENIRDHEKALAENRAARETVDCSAHKLEQAVTLSKMRASRFADFERSIRKGEIDVR